MCSDPVDHEVDGLPLCRGCAFDASPSRERERRREEDCKRYREQEERANRKRPLRLA